MWQLATGLRVDRLQCPGEHSVRSNAHTHCVSDGLYRTGKVALTERDLKFLLIFATDRQQFHSGLGECSDKSIQILCDDASVSTRAKFEATDLFLTFRKLRLQRFQIHLSDAQRAAVVISVCGLLSQVFLSETLLQVTKFG